MLVDLQTAGALHSDKHGDQLQTGIQLNTPLPPRKVANGASPKIQEKYQMQIKWSKLNIFLFWLNPWLNFLINQQNQMNKWPVVDYNWSSVHHLGWCLVSQVSLLPNLLLFLFFFECSFTCSKSVDFLPGRPASTPNYGNVASLVTSPWVWVECQPYALDTVSVAPPWAQLRTLKSWWNPENLSHWSGRKTKSMYC